MLHSRGRKIERVKKVIGRKRREIRRSESINRGNKKCCHSSVRCYLANHCLQFHLCGMACRMHAVENSTPCSTAGE